MEAMLPWVSLIVAVGGIVGTFSVMKWRIKQLEERRVEDKADFTKRVEEVRSAKQSKFAELKEDYDKQIQVCHKRISEAKEENKKDVEQIGVRIDKLGEKMDSNHQKLLDTIINTRK